MGKVTLTINGEPYIPPPGVDPHAELEFKVSTITLRDGTKRFCIHQKVGRVWIYHL